MTSFKVAARIELILGATGPWRSVCRTTAGAQQLPTLLHRRVPHGVAANRRFVAQERYDPKLHTKGSPLRLIEWHVLLEKVAVRQAFLFARVCDTVTQQFIVTCDDMCWDTTTLLSLFLPSLSLTLSLRTFVDLT